MSQMDEAFFAQCEEELTKINLFFSQKIAECQAKFHELTAELNTFKDLIESRQTPIAHRKYLTMRLRFTDGARMAATKLQKEQSKTAQQLKLAFRWVYKLTRFSLMLKIAIFSEFYLNLILLQNYQVNIIF